MKLAVGGCSFSDMRHNLITYGIQVAEHFGYDYLHAAACAGSNTRIWRVVTRAIIDKELVAGDVILLQYTILDRKEIWSPVAARFESPTEILDDIWEDGKLYRLTVHSAELAKSTHEKQMSKLHNMFTNYNYNKELWLTQHTAFTALCAVNNIRIVHINSQYDSTHRIKGINLDNILSDITCRMDSAHMNQRGHTFAANRIIQYLTTTATDSN